MNKEETTIFYPKTLRAWRKWLEKNHLSKESVWLAFYNKSSNKKTIPWSEAVDIALCYGWIDSKKIKIDEETAHQFFSKRKPNSTWSKINKAKVENLIEKKLMAEAGHRCIEIAKKNGSWTILDSLEELVTPKDLKVALRDKAIAKAYFKNLSSL